MTAATDSGLCRVAGHAFEDILDGYFPLSESVRQMMERHGFGAIWINLLHAPVMHISELPRDAPVPLHLPKTYSGMINAMAVSAKRTPGGVSLSGSGDWFWIDGREGSETFPQSTRLGEPAFVRGIGMGVDSGNASKNRGSNTVALVRVDPSARPEEILRKATGELGWRASRAWGLGRTTSGIHCASLQNIPHVLLGSTLEASDGVVQRDVPDTAAPYHDWDYLLVNISPDQADQNALELALRL